MNDIKERLKSIGFKQIYSSKEEVINFIHNVQHKDHCILVFNKDEARDEIVKEFLNKKHIRNSTTACFTNNPTKYECNHQMKYDNLVQEQKFQPGLLSEFLLEVLDDSYEKEQTRIVCEETSWLAENGMFDEHQKWGKTINQNIIDDSCIMCCYNVTKLTEDQMETVLCSRNHIILDEPFSVYKKEEELIRP